jgi:hypothetical protein
MMKDRPDWLTPLLISVLYRAEAEWRKTHVRAPEELAFNPEDIPGSNSDLHLIGYAVTRDTSVERGTFQLRRVITTRTVGHIETVSFR